MKEKIMETMYQLVAKQGYDKSSLSQVAEGVSLRKPSLYYYFPSKEALFLETIDKYYQECYQPQPEMMEKLQTKEEFSDYFREFATKALQEFQADKTLQAFYFEVNLQSIRLPVVGEYFQERDRTCEKLLRKLLEKGVELSALSEDLNFSRELDTIFALLVGLSEMILYNMKVQALDVWEAYVQRLLTN